MPALALSDAQLRAIWEAVAEHGGIPEASAALGLGAKTGGDRYRRALRDLGLEDVRRAPRAVAALGGAPTPRDAAAPFTVGPLPSGDEPIEELIARRATAFARKAEAREARELIPVRVRIDGPYGILHMGDPHVDDDGCDWPTLLRHLELIDQTEGLFAANVGDLHNNWVGRLARLYASQGTTAADALRMVEWFVGRVRWCYLIGGNHDAWSGAADPVKWLAGQAGTAYQWHGMRLELQASAGPPVRINARHDFSGTSQWNGAHAPAKAARMGWTRDHIYTCGHRHMAAHNTVFMNDGEHVAHAIRLGAYKKYDDYSDAKGFPRENVPAAVTVINPAARDALGLVTVFWDVEAAADYLRWLRRPRVRVAAGRQ